MTATTSPPKAFDPERFLAGLTRKPGVYQMLNERGDVLYVGKAKNLKARVTSYFRASGLNAKTMALVARICDIHVTVTHSETEAFLLEQSLIKKARPHYNIVLRDDKSYPFIYLTDGDYPRLTFHRGAKRKSGRYVGPFPSASAVRESLNILQRLFQIRQCDESFFRNRSRPCLQYQIKRCSGPCVGHISPQEYSEDVNLAIMFLEGKNREVFDRFSDRMTQASDAQQYERAAKYRDQISQLRKVQEQQYVHADHGDVDIFAVASEGGVSCVQGLFIRKGRLLGNRTWFPRNQLAVDDTQLMNEFLAQYYLAGRHGEIPRNLVVGVPCDDMGLLAETLTSKAGFKVVVSHRVRTQKARWLEMARENATLSLNAFLADKRNIFARFVALQEALDLEDVPQRLECFDISHSSGEATVASCVVFDHNGPVKSDYRRFNISGITAADDYAAMSQALQRRYTRLKSGEGKLPDILVIDGGMGQLGVAHQVLQQLQVEGVCLLGIAKGPTRKPGLESLFVAGQGEVFAPPQGPAMHLLQHIRDEAHRFAITGHRQRRDKRRRESELESIPGVGPTRKRELLRHFGSIRSLRGASQTEIATVPGINQKLAEEIYTTLHLEP